MGGEAREMKGTRYVHGGRRGWRDLTDDTVRPSYSPSALEQGRCLLAGQPAGCRWNPTLPVARGGTVNKASVMK